MQRESGNDIDNIKINLKIIKCKINKDKMREIKICDAHYIFILFLSSFYLNNVNLLLNYLNLYFPTRCRRPNPISNLKFW